MARPIVTAIQTAVQNIFLAITDVKSHYEAPRMSQALDEIIAGIGVLYGAFSVTVPAAQATLTPLFAGALLTAKNAASVYGSSAQLANMSLQIGDNFTVTSSVDTTNTALATAKGSAPAAGDIFEITNVSAPAVAYMGSAQPVLTAYNYQTFTA